MSFNNSGEVFLSLKKPKNVPNTPGKSSFSMKTESKNYCKTSVFSSNVSIVK